METVLLWHTFRNALYCTSHCYWRVDCVRVTHVHRHTPNIGSVWFVYSVFFLSGSFNETVCTLHLFRVNSMGMALLVTFSRLNSYKPCRNGTPLAYIGNALFYIRHANHFQHLWSVLQPITCCWTILRKVFCGSTEVRSRRYPGHGSSLQPKWMRSESMKHRQKGDPCQQETYTLMGRVNRHLALCEITTSSDQRTMGLGIAMTIYCNLDVKISCCRFYRKTEHSAAPSNTVSIW